jgi:hypothetical protein
MAKQRLTTLVADAMEAGKGILHLAPTWVPRSFATPGQRLRIARQDLYALGVNRGGIDERWLASATKADNGPDTSDHEGLSFVVGPRGERFLLREAIEVSGEYIVGKQIMNRWGRWPVLGKFFDNMGPLPLHLHQQNIHARLVGAEHKPEAYYFPPQLNHSMNSFPLTFFGLEPGTRKADICRCLEQWHTGDNGILDFSKAYRLRPGTGWLVPPGILHAPGSLCTYEVQWGSEVFAMFQSMVESRALPWDQLVNYVPDEQKMNIDFITNLIDWSANVNPEFKMTHYLEPIAAQDTTSEGYRDNWIIYGKILDQDLFSAKEITIETGRSATIKDNGASGAIVIQGHGKLGVHDVESPTSIRYGEVTSDEYFISDEAARAGFQVENTGTEPLVILRYFGPDAGNIFSPNVERLAPQE